MIHFEHIEYLWLLCAVAVLGALWVLMQWRERKRLRQWADAEMLARMGSGLSGWRPATKTVLTLLGAALLVVSIANPQVGTKVEKGTRAGSDVAICLDVSNSMMAEDLKPNRLERAKRAVSTLLGGMAGDRVSLVVFAGTSFVQMPLTNDYSAAKLFLDGVSCDMISTQGTAIGDAINKAMQTFGYDDPDRPWEKNKGRAIVVISDGENHEDDAVEAARQAKKEGVRVCSIGMGLPQGSPIPDGKRGGYKRDHDGNVVMTHLNEQMLRDVAAAGGGAYVSANNAGNTLSDITKLIEGLEKEEYGETVFSAYESRYQYPLAAAIACLLAELLLFERRSRRWRIFESRQQ